MVVEGFGVAGLDVEGVEVAIGVGDEGGEVNGGRGVGGGGEDDGGIGLFEEWGLKCGGGDGEGGGEVGGGGEGADGV